MAQYPKPHTFPNIIRETGYTRTNLSETDDSLGLLDWVQLPFASNGFVHYDYAAFGPCVYTKDRNGFVHLRGLMFSALASAPALGTVVATLPVGFRPVRTELIIVGTQAGSVRFDMYPSGELQYIINIVGAWAAGTYFTLAGVNWWAPPQ